MIDKPILITGCARSGTSMTAGIINIGGAWGGKMAGTTIHNKRGMYENTEIRNGIVKRYLRSLKVDPLCQHPLPPIKFFKDLRPGASIIDYWRLSIERVIKHQGYPGTVWFYKGAKMCLIWPLWHLAFPNARWIIVRRRDEDIVYSCMKTGFMKAFKHEDGWYKWVKHHLARFEEMIAEPTLDVREIWPQDMINGDLTSIQAIVEELGLQWKKKEVIEFISPALWSSGKLKEVRERENV